MTTRTQIPIFRPESTNLNAALTRLSGGVTAAALRTESHDIRLDVAVPGAMTMNTTSERGELCGMLSLSGPLESQEQATLRAAIEGEGLLGTFYRTQQDVPRDYDRTWGTGTSPGVRQLTFLRRRPGLSDEEFREHWFGVHGPLALRIHPIWRYDRNVVVSQEDDAPLIEGIVGLHFRELADVSEPLRLYGGDYANARLIAEDVASFIDMKTIVVSVMQERILRAR